MKFYVFVLSVICLSFSGCKKDRSCNCTVSTSGSRTTHSQSAGVTFTLNIGLPLPIPPVTLTQPTDTTITMPFGYSNTHKTNYDKLSKRDINKICPSSFEETFTDGSTTIIPGTSTVTVSESGKKKYTCKIE